MTENSVWLSVASMSNRQEHKRPHIAGLFRSLNAADRRFMLEAGKEIGRRHFTEHKPKWQGVADRLRAGRTIDRDHDKEYEIETQEDYER